MQLVLAVSTSNSVHKTQFYSLKIGCNEEQNVTVNT